MRFVVVGAGAVGGVVGGRLAQHGHAVVFVARGRQYDALRAAGLRIESPAGTVQVHVPAVERPDQIDWRPDDVVLLSVKGDIWRFEEEETNNWHRIPEGRQQQINRRAG